MYTRVLAPRYAFACEKSIRGVEHGIVRPRNGYLTVIHIEIVTGLLQGGKGSTEVHSDLEFVGYIGFPSDAA